MFNIENISKSYGKNQVLNNISFFADAKEAVGILGVNGSGKSTLLSCIVEKYSDLDIGYLPQSNPLFDELKPVDNIRMWCKLTKKEIIEKLNTPPLAELGIINFIDKPVSTLSGGMKKRLSLATVLINNPSILLMDEPFAALDLPAKQDILYYMQNFRADGGTIILASHDEDIFNFCNRVLLLKNGSLIDTNELRKNGISFIDILRN
ncbi:MAG: ABC transporter ATP-binding protein [Lachnospiraceae bacterium]|nr:ABC transporter ATP-binding protein [Lachnospiraceae bacterium]